MVFKFSFIEVIIRIENNRERYCIDLKGLEMKI